MNALSECISLNCDMQDCQQSRQLYSVAQIEQSTPTLSCRISVESK